MIDALENFYIQKTCYPLKRPFTQEGNNLVEICTALAWIQVELYPEEGLILQVIHKLVPVVLLFLFDSSLQCIIELELGTFDTALPLSVD